ncbi:MFS transporter [Clostridium saccharobutylicum]|uniref:Enterobactin exporter EntS n=1 Tax=Clostridium saccharobutylicum TaxID=169679 RepID=A0A1S8MTI0_CLOSA|nr:MFS transporter [Clostridium saccharobutylicum]OOM07464.1 enterobactin exporter EntS [Clostridium saccharobutylicum]
MFLKNRIGNYKFYYYIIGDIISSFGTGMTMIGLNWFILEASDSSFMVSLFMIVQLISGAVFSSLIGGLIDYYKRRDVLIVSNFVRGITIFIVIILYLFTTNYYLLFILAVINGVGWTTYASSSRALVQEILSEKELRCGNSFVEISMQIGLFLASGASGIIYKYVGIVGILTIDAITFFVSNIFLYKIKIDNRINKESKDGYIEKIKDGKKYAVDNKLIFTFGIFIFIPFVVTMASNVVLPEYVMISLNSNSVIFGITDMLYGVGACLAGVIITNTALKDGKSENPIYFYNIISMLALVFLYINKAIPPLLVAYLLFGLCNTSLRILLNSYIMTVVPKDNFGYVMSIWMAISNILQGIAVISIGWIISRVSANWGYVILSGIMLISLFLLFYFFNKIKKQ